VTFAGQFPNKYPIIYLFKVNLNKSKYILELVDNSKMTRNLKVVLLRDTIAVHCVTVRTDAGILKLAAATNVSQ